MGIDGGRYADGWITVAFIYCGCEKGSVDGYLTFWVIFMVIGKVLRDAFRFLNFERN